MIIIMQPGASDKTIDRVEQSLQANGYRVHRSLGDENVVLGAVGTPRQHVDPRNLQLMPGVREVHRIQRPYKFVDRACNPGGTVVDVAGVRIGGDEIVVIAGPCAVESREQMMLSAAAVSAAGARILRGGAYKPRTSPYSFQGLGEAGLQLLREAADRYRMPCVTEVVDAADVEVVERYADMLQVGARNMQNFRLLAAVGASSKPVFLKRGAASTLDELLLAAEHIVSSGNPKVVLCERGVRTFEPSTRNTMDLSAIIVLRRLTHLPIVADPSHATGIRDAVAPMARAAVAAGADGVMIEVHHDPANALCDGAQSLDPAGFVDVMGQLRIIAPAVKRRLPRIRPGLRSPLEQPLFQRGVVVGVGLIGGSLALALRESGAVGHVTGVDQEPHLEAIRASGAVDEVVEAAQLEEALKGADLVVLATPVLSILETLGEIGPCLEPGALVTDVGSTKVAICAAASGLPEGVHFIGGHPMAGSERTGATASDPLLFHGSAWCLCPPARVPDEVLDRWRRALQSIGAHPVELEPSRHDTLTAAVSHVPHLVAAAMANSVGRLGVQDPLALRLAAGGFRAVTRTASGPFHVWGGILATNRDAVVDQLSAFREALDDLEEALGSVRSLRDELTEARQVRQRLTWDRAEVHRPTTELMVRVADEPGALATVTTALAHEEINICDIEVLKVRPDEEGSLRLAFGSPDETARAAGVLRDAGYQVKHTS